MEQLKYILNPYDLLVGRLERGHIAEHGVTRAEAEFVVEHAAPPFPAKSADGKSVVWGQTRDGRYLQVIFVHRSEDEIDFESFTFEDLLSLEDGGGPVIYVVHAMDLTPKMKRQYRRRKELIMPVKAKKKSFFEMTPAERDADVKQFDSGLSLDELRPLSAKNKLLWEMAKRRPGRPRLGTGAVKVLVTLDPALLEEVDTYAKNHRLKRSQLISRALKNEIRRAS